MVAIHTHGTAQQTAEDQVILALKGDASTDPTSSWVSNLDRFK